MFLILRGLFRHGIGNNQFWLAGCVIAADEVHIITCQIVIVINTEIQTELGAAGAIDETAPGTVQRHAIPTSGRCSTEKSNRGSRCS